MTLRYAFSYLRELLYHKWLVLLEGRKLGLPLSQLILHDISKFLPDEWPAGVAYYRSLRSGYDPRDQAPQDKAQQNEALRTHYRRNQHHPQHWVKDDSVLPMPERYRLEMLADWRAVERVKGGSTAEWYQAYGYKFPFHPETRAWVEEILAVSENPSEFGRDE